MLSRTCHTVAFETGGGRGWTGRRGGPTGTETDRTSRHVSPSMEVPESDEVEGRRTRLAEERTRLARERTTLAHIRTGFASFLFGTAVLGLFTTIETDLLGGVFVLIGVVFLVTGWRSYVLSNRRTRHLLREVEQSVKRR